METYIVTIYAKEDHADDVEQYYKGLQPLYEEAQGFIERKIFRAKTGGWKQFARHTQKKNWPIRQKRITIMVNTLL